MVMIEVVRVNGNGVSLFKSNQTFLCVAVFDIFNGNGGVGIDFRLILTMDVNIQ